MQPTNSIIQICAALVIFSGYPASADTVAVTKAQVKGMEIQLETVRDAATETVALLPGTVVPAIDARRIATAPFEGTVVQLHVLPGQKVARGAPLVTISSRELLQSMSELAQSEAELQVASAIARRKRILVTKKFQSAVVAEEAEAQVAKIQAVIDQHKRMASLHGISVKPNGEYTIPAPTDGRIDDTPAMPGKKLESMDPAVIMDSSEALWIEVQVPADLVDRIHVGDSVRVIDGPRGKVVSIGGSLDRMTRSAVMYASISGESRLMPGQMVTLTIEHDAVTGALSVPASAVARVANQTTVFKRTPNGFKLVPVTLHGKSAESATISGDLDASNQVASSGLPQLEQMLAGD